MASTTDPARLAEQHAEEAERLLKNRFGLINLFIKAQVHASLAVYYGALAAGANHTDGGATTP